MTEIREVTCRPPGKRTKLFFVGLGTAGAILAAWRLALRGTLLDAWLGVGLLLVPTGLEALRGVVAGVRADPYGLHIRTLLRRRSVPWRDIADLQVHPTGITAPGR